MITSNNSITSQGYCFMPNFIDQTPLLNVLKTKKDRVRTPQAEEWFSRNARNWLRLRDDCAQSITLAEADLPDWAILKMEVGDLLHRFHLSEYAAETLTDALRYVRALEFTILDEPNIESKIVDEARSRLNELRHIRPDETSDRHHSWRQFRRGNVETPPSNEPILAQVDDYATKFNATNHRVWQRITTLGRLKDTGIELNNCLQHGYYDEEFIAGEFAFWRLNDKNEAALAVMRINIAEDKALEFKALNNQFAIKYAQDAVTLLKENFYQIDDESDGFIEIRITTDGLKINTGNPDAIYTGTRIWGHGKWVYLQKNNKKLLLHLGSCSTLGELLLDPPQSNFNFGAKDYDWLGRSIAYYLNQTNYNIVPNLDELVVTTNGWQYWRDDIIETAIFNQIQFHKTSKGIVNVADNDSSPNYVIRKHNIRAGQAGPPMYVYRLSDSGFDVIKNIEANQATALGFWSWVDPNKTMGPSYSSLFEATNNPCCSNLQTTGWFQANDPESWSEWINGIIPNLPDGISIKQRYVFDEEGFYDYVVGTHTKRYYALQLAVFVQQKLEISCLISGKSNRQNNWQSFFKMLTSDFKSPSAVAALLSALWIEMGFQGGRKSLQNYLNHNLNVSALVTRVVDVRPHYFSPRLDFNNYQNNIASIPLDKVGENLQIYSVDNDGNLLWFAEKYGIYLTTPIIYQRDPGLENSTKYIQAQGLSVNYEWHDILKSIGYIVLENGAINRIMSAHLNSLETSDKRGSGQIRRRRRPGTLYKCVEAIRVLDENEFTWKIYVNGDYEASWILHPAHSHNYLKLQPTDNLIGEDLQDQEVSPEIKSLIHAILDGCGKTMSPAQLGILNLMPMATGGHQTADADNFPLSNVEVRIDVNLAWVQKSIDWHLMQDNRSICRFSYAPVGTEFFSIPAIPITEEIASAIVHFSNLLQQAVALPNRFILRNEDELSKIFPDIRFCSDINEDKDFYC